jgi:hypothetical protein
MVANLNDCAAWLRSSHRTTRMSAAEGGADAQFCLLKLRSWPSSDIDTPAATDTD